MYRMDKRLTYYVRLVIVIITLSYGISLYYFVTLVQCKLFPIVPSVVEMYRLTRLSSNGLWLGEAPLGCVPGRHDGV